MSTRIAQRFTEVFGRERKPRPTQYPIIHLTMDTTPVARYRGRWLGLFRGKTDRFRLIDDCLVNVYVPLLQYCVQFTIPAGFLTDGVSSPQWLWPLFPPHGLAFNPAAVHGYLYEYRPHFLDRKLCDQIFLGLMLHAGVPKLQAQVMYAYVRAVGWRNWNRFRKAERARYHAENDEFLRKFYAKNPDAL